MINTSLSENSPKVKWGIKWKAQTILTILMVSMIFVLAYIQLTGQKKNPGGGAK